MLQRHQVVIVGGGPVGLALAVELGQRGVSCVLIEQHLEPQRIPKGQNLTNRSLEHFYFWNCVQELRAARVMPPGYPIGGVTAYRNLMSEYWYAAPNAIGREAASPFYFQANERLPQYLTEEVLRRRVAQLPNVECRFGWMAEDVAQEDERVSVGVVDRERGIREALQADYVVGCDGTRSHVREIAGIGQTGAPLDRKMVLTVFRSHQLHSYLERFPQCTTFRVLDPNQKGYWRFFGRIDVGEGFFFHAPVPEDAQIGDFDLQGLLEEAAGISFEAEFDYVGFWDLRITVADTYRNGRIFIAGDACHSHPPYGAFGLNTGLEDVRNLGWKLAARLEGWGTDALLDSYTEERRPVFIDTGESMIRGRIESDRAFLERYSPEKDPEEFEDAWKQLGSQSSRISYEPNYEGSSIVSGPPGSVCGVQGTHTFTARAGHHLAPAPLSSGRNVFEDAGSGFTLMALGADDADLARFIASANELVVPLEVLRDTFEQERRLYEWPLILVRPDQFIAWAGASMPADPSSLLRRAVGRH